jgi:hypothetical protein
MQKEITKAIDNAGEQLERATQEQASLSKQPRFGIAPSASNQMFWNIYSWAKGTIFDEPKYAPDSRRRDTWLANIVLKEPYLLGVLQSVVSIDKNRGFTMTGGKTQVKRFMRMAHDFQVAPDLSGWRPGLSVTARNFYQSDLGGLVELGRAAEDGPLAALYSVDPTRCHLTGQMETPLRYAGATKSENGTWKPNDYFRVTSFPSTIENMNGLGYCAVSRCLELAKMTVSVFEHDRERLGSKAPKGILTINGGLTMDQWLQSLEESTAELKTLEREYYAGVQVLVGSASDKIEVALTSLSSLPEQFDHQTFVNLMMFGYALAFGYDPREFWPVSGGTLGTGTETESQHRKATSKGGLDFALGFQEKLQDELPDTIQFEFEQRDVDGDISEAAFNKAKFDIINGMYMSKDANNQPLITHDQAMQLMVEAKLIPEEWTIIEEEVTASDTDDVGDIGNIDTSNMLTKQRVQNAINKFPNDDIVIYSSTTGKFRTIRKAGAEKKFVSRAPRSKLLASVKGVDITAEDVAKAMKDTEQRLGKKATAAFAGPAKNG